MLKKIAAVSLITSSLLYGDIDARGVFIGLELGQMNAESSYDRTLNFTSAPKAYSSKEKYTDASLKLGYQYYFTRVYALIKKKKDLEDKAQGLYKIQNQTVELNVDYLPLFYMNDNKNFTIRGIFGLGIGANKSKLLEYDPSLDTTGTVARALDKESQMHMEYGYQLGIMCETSIGFNLELGYRVRYGDLLEFTNDKNDQGDKVSFDLYSNEYYIGLNYLF